MCVNHRGLEHLLEYAKVARNHYPPAADVIDETCQADVSWHYGERSPNLTQLNLRLQNLNNFSSIPWQQK